MKFIISLLLTALLSFAACLYLPWWVIAPVAFLVAAVTGLVPGRAFLAGFLAIFLLWATLSFKMSAANDHILAHKVAQLLFKTDSPYLLIAITAFIGGLVAGFAALAGAFTRKKPGTIA